MDVNSVDFYKAAEEIENFIKNNLTNKLAEIYKNTGVLPADSFEFLKECLYDNSGFDIVNEANKLTREENNNGDKK